MILNCMKMYGDFLHGSFMKLTGHCMHVAWGYTQDHKNPTWEPCMWCDGIIKTMTALHVAWGYNQDCESRLWGPSMLREGALKTKRALNVAWRYTQDHEDPIFGVSVQCTLKTMRAMYLAWVYTQYHEGPVCSVRVWSIPWGPCMWREGMLKTMRAVHVV
jgi:hypothetical protein